ncbi:putative membrane-anchored protein [Novosphingobium capsulatum]|uniref:Membrane-anchored protein n=1 Tax=Novosphingobium capsulatum TaxID=13688 RepID=A0ABU1MJQ7_9SPHN|nr:DUF3422 family protein [Novosphingobium capsulatum]MDR6510563.1 putative membrane-anchored protein [Novosphingobium capsulatum]
MHEHEWRRQIVNEMHLRRWPVLRAPMQVVQQVRLVDDAARDAEWAAWAAMPEGGEVRRADRRHVSGTLAGGVSFTWERHSEASTQTLFAPLDSDISAAIAWMESLPGATVRATRLVIVADEADAAQVMPAMGLVHDDLVSCHVAGPMRIWSDFHIGEDGYGRMLVAACGLEGGDLTRAVQRLQELSSYRNLALLGLPVARAAWPRLDQAEADLRRLGEALTRDDVRDDDLMDQLSGLSLAIAAVASTTDYRMSATAAYALLVEERLADLAPRPIPGFLSLGEFTQRRFLPAVRTCAAFSRRERQVAARAGQFTALLRARIETRIENQNGALLASLERSAVRQLRLQHLVEGLSVVGISYYATALIGHVLEGGESLVHFDARLAVGVITPLVMLATWLALRHARRQVLDHPSP